LTKTQHQNTRYTRKVLGLRKISLANQKATRLMLLLSAGTLIVSLVLFAGNPSAGLANAVPSSTDLQNAIRLEANEMSNIVISSPQNMTYTWSDIPLTFTMYGSRLWIGYSLDGQANVTAAGNTTLTNLPQGPHHIIIYFNDTAGNMHSSDTVYFTTTYVSLLETITLGLIQGLAEWLPISSTAHLKIAEQFLGLTHTGLLDVVLHVGTLVVVVFYFRKEVKAILAALVHLDFKSEYGQFIPLIVIATIPTGIIGLVYAKFLEDTLQTFLIIGITFLIGATVLYMSRVGKQNTDSITIMVAFIMGIAQGLAIFPGLSRSGITISTALLLGLRREKTFKFSFLLSIPAIIGDLAVEAYKQHGQLAAQVIGPIELLAGIVTAIIAGYVAIRIVSNLVRTKKFHYFAVYTLILGMTLTALSLSGLLTT
jgi:undecaprenyl-diphosphatase